MLSLESACFRTQACPSETFEMCFGEVVSPSTPSFWYLSQDSHNKIYNIYDKHMHLEPPFQSLYEREV